MYYLTKYRHTLNDSNLINEQIRFKSNYLMVLTYTKLAQIQPIITIKIHETYNIQNHNLKLQNKLFQY